MGKVISFNKAVKEREDEENRVFAPRKDEGELKDILDWEGQDWEALFEAVFVPIAHQKNISPFDLLAEFIHAILTMEDNHDSGKI